MKEKIKSKFVSLSDNYGRSVTLEIETAMCLFCGETKQVLSIDVSDGEYLNGRICKDCIDKVFNN